MFNTLDISFYSFCHYKTTRSVFLPTAADPSLAFRMTINVSCHSEWTQECCVKKKGKRDGDTE